MKTILLAGVLGVASLGAAALTIQPSQTTEAEAPRALTDKHLAFLAGHWVSESPDGAVVEEHWLEPVNGSITGMLRWRNAAGEIGLLEILTIQTEDGQGIFRWRHFDKDLTPWEAEKEVPSIVAIESFEGNKLVMVRHPDGSSRTPAKMTYDGSVPGELTATLEFDTGRDPVVIAFKRR
ncbi:MAG: DUF6265 family protein [Phycisphaerales bacterium]